MAKLLLKGIRYLKFYGRLTLARRPQTPEAAVDFCADSPILVTQVRSEITELGTLLQAHAPMHSLEIGTNYGGTLFLLFSLSPPGALIISVDLPGGRFGGGYPRRKIPLYRKFPRNGQRLRLVRADSHLPGTKQHVECILAGNRLDYLFIDGDHTYEGVKRDFQMYSPLVRSGGIIALHDIAKHQRNDDCQVDNFWNEVKQHYRYREIIENPDQGWAGIGVLFVP